MDILWVGLAISAVVGFVFYVMADYWRRLLRSHSKAIRSLAVRVEELEERESERLMRRVERKPATPAEEVFIFIFRLGERFWHETMEATPEQMAYLREHGKFLGAARIEHKGSRVAVALTELLPQNQSAGWETRNVEIDTSNSGVRSALLWEIHLEPPTNFRGRSGAPGLELRFEDETLVLLARHEQKKSNSKCAEQARLGEEVIFRVPLDDRRLDAYRSANAEAEVSADAEGEIVLPVTSETGSPMTIYQNQDHARHVDWQLCTRGPEGQSEEESWTVVEPMEEKRV